MGFLNKSFAQEHPIPSAEALENYKFECQDVLQILGSISQALKPHLKARNSRLSIDEIKQIDIQCTSAKEKIREIEAQGGGFHEAQAVSYGTIKGRLEAIQTKVRSSMENYKNVCQSKLKKAEDRNLEFAFKEYDLN